MLRNGLKAGGAGRPYCHGAPYLSEFGNLNLAEGYDPQPADSLLPYTPARIATVGHGRDG